MHAHKFLFEIVARSIGQAAAEMATPQDGS
jgi:hypothetical protein